MLDLSKLRYRVTCVSDGGQLDLTPISTGLGISEGAKELAAKIQLKVSAQAEFNGKSVSELLKPFVTIVVFADMGDGYVEVCRGKIQKLSVTETNHDFYLDVEATDDAGELRKTQADFYFTADHTSTAILDEVFKKHGLQVVLNIADIKHSKKVYRGKYLADIVDDVLKDIREAGKGDYFVRSTCGKIEIVKRGDNLTCWSFDAAENVSKVSESYDASKTVTQVQVVGKSKDEGHPPVEQTVNGRIDTGTRKIIYRRPSNETPADAEKAAKKILDEQGEPKLKLTIETVDVPTLRKNDRIRLRTATGTKFYTVSSARHNCVSRKMTLELAYDKDADKSLLGQFFGLADGSTSDSTAPP